MFKRLKEKITEEVWDSPSRLQSSLQTLGQYSPFKDNGNKKASNPESEASTPKDSLTNLIDLQESSSSVIENAQFSITEDDEACSIPSPPTGQNFAFENVDLSEASSTQGTVANRPRTPTVTSPPSQPPPFFTVYNPPSTSYNVQSDLESASEVEDSGINLDIVSKEQLYDAFQKAKIRYIRYKSRYADVVKAYRDQENEKEKIRTILTESQDKALRRISELKEQSLLERKAKQHLEESFRITLEEKDELVRVLQVQIRLLKSGNNAIEKESNADVSQSILDSENEMKTSETKDECNAAVQLITKSHRMEELQHVEPESAWDTNNLNETKVAVVDNEAVECTRCDTDETFEKPDMLQQIPFSEVILTSHNDVAVHILKDNISKHILSLQQLLNDYKNSCSQMKTDIFHYKEDILNYHNIVEDQVNKLSVIHKGTLQHFWDNILDIQKQKGSLNEEVFNFKKDLEQCISKISSSLNEVEEYYDVQTEKQDKEEKEKSDSVSSCLQEELDKANQKILHYEQQISAMHEVKNELCSNIETVRMEYFAKLEESESLNRVLQDQVRSLQNANETITVKLKDLETMDCQKELDIESLKNTIISLEELNCNARKDNDNLKGQVEISEKATFVLENLKSELENELRKAKDNHKQDEVAYHEALEMKNNALKDLNNEKDSLKEDLRCRDETIMSLNQMLKELSNVDDELRQQQENFDASLIKVNQENQQLKDNLKLECEKNATLLQKMTDSSFKYENMEKVYVDQLNLLKKTIIEKDNITMESKQQLNRNFVLGLGNMEIATKGLKYELNSLKQQLLSTKQEYDHHINMLGIEIGTKVLEVETLQKASVIQNEEILKSNENLVRDLQQQCSSLVNEKQTLQTKLMEYTHATENMETQLKRQFNKQLVELRNKTSEHVALLRQQLQNMKSEVDIDNKALQAKTMELYAEIEKKEHLLRQEQQRSKELQDHYEEKMSLLDRTLKEAHQKSDAEKIALVEHIREINIELGNLKLSFNNSGQHCQELSLTSESTKANVDELPEGAECFTLVKDSNAAISFLKSRISSLVDENSSIKQSITANVTQIKELSNSYEEKLSSLERELESTKEYHKEKFESQQKLHKDKMTDLVQKFKVKLKTINAERSELKQQNDELQSQINKLQEEVLTLQDVNTNTTINANKDIEKLSLELQSSKNELSLLSSNLDEIESLKVNIKNFESTIKELEEKNTNSAALYQEELLNLQKEIKANQAIIDKLEALNEDFKQKLQSKEKLESEIRRECQEVQKSSEKTSKELQDTISFLKGQVDDLKSTLSDKNIEISDLQSQMERSASWAEEKTEILSLLDDLKNQLASQKNEFEAEIKSLEEKHDNLMKSKEQQCSDQTQSLLSELKKKTETKLAQIKKQLLVETNKVKDLEAYLVEVTEKLKNSDVILEEKDLEISQLRLSLSETKNNYDSEINVMNTTLNNERVQHATEKENLLTEIATKNSQIDESLINAQVNHMEMTRKLDALQAEFDEAKAMWNIREAAEINSSFISSQERNMVDEDSQTTEEGEATREHLECIDQIEKYRLLMSENEMKLKEKDDEHIAKIKQLVKEFSAMIALKEEEGRQALVKAIECNIHEDNRLRRDHAHQLQALQEELAEKELLFDSIIEEKDKLIQEKSDELGNFSRNHDEMMSKIKTDHQTEIGNLEKKWRTFLQKKLDQQINLQEEDVKALTHEWDVERKFLENDLSSVAKIDVFQEELQHQANLASSAVESGNQSNDLLRRQIMAMHSQMEAMKERHKAEVCELRDLLQSTRKYTVPSSQSASGDIYDDSCNLKSLEIETLAKVIAAVVRFSDEQLNKILEKEQSRGPGGVGGQLVQFLK